MYSFEVGRCSCQQSQFAQLSLTLRFSLLLFSSLAHGLSSPQDFKVHGSEANLRAAGKLRQEGRKYLVQDGDVVFFKHNS